MKKLKAVKPGPPPPEAQSAQKRAPASKADFRSAATARCRPSLPACESAKQRSILVFRSPRTVGPALCAQGGPGRVGSDDGAGTRGSVAARTTHLCDGRRPALAVFGRRRAPSRSGYIPARAVAGTDDSRAGDGDRFLGSRAGALRCWCCRVRRSACPPPPRAPACPPALPPPPPARPRGPRRDGTPVAWGKPRCAPPS